MQRARDARLQEEPGPVHTSRRIEDAALELFFHRGYKATTMREIALACGLTPGALYNHFPAKEQLLASIIVGVHRELQRSLREAVAGAAPDPTSRLRAFCRAHALFHTTYITEARVANREIGALPDDAHDEVVAIRREATEALRDILREGRDRSVFDVPNVNAVANLILTMAVQVASWYRPSGELSKEQMADLDAEMAVRMVKGDALGGDRS